MYCKLDEVWDIFTDSFEDDLRRSYEGQKQLLNDRIYHLDHIIDEGVVVGFISWWDLDEFIFVEHFAVDKNQRGKGLGARTVCDMLGKDKTIILEVEPAHTLIDEKRIAFYKRCGMFLNEYFYMQPALQPSYKPVELIIMSSKPLLEDEFNKVKHTLYKKIYKLEDSREV